MHEFCTIVRAQYLQKNFFRIFLYLLQNLCWKPRIRGVILRRFLRLRGSFSGRRPPKIKKTRLETANRIPTFLIPGTWINSFMWINSFGCSRLLRNLKALRNFEALKSTLYELLVPAAGILALTRYYCATTLFTFAAHST